VIVVANNRAMKDPNLLLRIVGGVIFILGLTLFLFIGFLLNIKVADTPPVDFFQILEDIILYRFFVAGIVPLIVGGYFTLMFKRDADFFVGIFLIIPLFIVFHYLVAVFSVHPDDVRYILIQLFEVICGATVIFRYQRRYKTLSR